jgi:hypothetical protein
MNLDTTYALILVVSTADGRSATKIVTLSAVDSGSAQVSITSTFVKFNPGSVLTIYGNITATFDVTANWDVKSSSGVSVPYTALTPKIQQILAVNSLFSIAFPLLISANTFTAGSVFCFRLTVQRDGNTKRTFTEIILTANSVPTGGIVTSIPSAGTALDTIFVIETSGWATDAENFPLSYAFSYQLSTRSPFLTLAALSLRSFVGATLPAGLATQSNLIILQGKVVDLFLSSSIATSTIKVGTNTNLNITELLRTNIAIGTSSGDVNLIFQTINNVRC